MAPPNFHANITKHCSGWFWIDLEVSVGKSNLEGEHKPARFMIKLNYPTEDGSLHRPPVFFRPLPAVYGVLPLMVQYTECLECTLHSS